MTRARDDWDDDRDGVDERDDPQSIDMDDEDDELPTLECANCSAEIAEGADRCPYCGSAVAGPAPASRRWIVGVALLVLSALAIWYLASMIGCAG